LQLKLCSTVYQGAPGAGCLLFSSCVGSSYRIAAADPASLHRVQALPGKVGYIPDRRPASMSACACARLLSFHIQHHAPAMVLLLQGMRLLLQFAFQTSQHSHLMSPALLSCIVAVSWCCIIACVCDMCAQSVGCPRGTLHYIATVVTRVCKRLCMCACCDALWSDHPCQVSCNSLDASGLGSNRVSEQEG
jgi:hypothetical protein